MIGSARIRRRVRASLIVGMAAGVLAAPAGAATSPQITFPASGDTVDVGELAVRGTLEQTGAEDAWVVFAVDVSGSTGANGHDCDNSGGSNVGDDFNADGSRGEILDCEIAGVIALNTSLAAIPGSAERIHVGMVPFGSSAAVADIGGSSGHQDFVSPIADLDTNSRDRTADVVQVASSLDQGTARLFTQKFVGTGTNFSPALDNAFNILQNKTGKRVVFLLTDGFGTISQTTINRMTSLGIEVRPYSITAGADRCSQGGSLDRIGDASGFPCTWSEDPTTLAATLTGQPATIDRIEVRVDGGPAAPATIDPLGNWTANVVVGSGSHTAVVTVFYKDGTSATDSVTFTAQGGIRYVALGDSYSAGEGIEPWFEVPGPGKGCHQSEKGYATFVGDEDYELPGDPDVNLDYVACSGAVLKDIVAVQQNARGERHIVQLSRVDAGADLLTLTVGGNDLGFSEVLSHCATQADCQNDGYATLNSGRSLTLDEFLDVRLALFRPEVESLYRTLRERTEDNASIVALNYPELFDDGDLLRLSGCPEADVFGKGEREYLNDRVEDLRDSIDDAAGSAGVWFADVIEEFRGHRVCEGTFGTGNEWLVGIELAGRFPPVGDASFHPDPDGAKAYARVITEFLREKDDEGVPSTPAGLPANPGAGTASASFAAASRSASTADPEADDQATPARASKGERSAQPQTAETAEAAGVQPLTPEEVEEIAAMEFGPADLTTLATLRGQESCVGRYALGQQIVVTGSGFAPGSSVATSLKAASEDDVRTYPQSLVADAEGNVAASLVVPFDLLPNAGYNDELPWTVASLWLDGTSPAGGHRRLGHLLTIDPPGGECTQQVAAAGDIAAADGSAAPSAAGTPGLPGTLLTLGPAGPTIDILPGVDPNEVEAGGNDLFTVALRGSPGFDVLSAKFSKMRFGHDGDEQTPMGTTFEDIDSDGDLDQVLRFMANQTEIACGDNIATLTGVIDGRPFGRNTDEPFRAADRVKPTGCDG